MKNPILILVLYIAVISAETEIEIKDIVARPGGSLNLNCEIAENFDICIVNFEKNWSCRFPGDCDHGTWTSSSSNVCQITLNNVQIEHGGMYQCTVGTLVETTNIVKVKYRVQMAKEAEIKLRDDGLKAKEGQEKLITCIGDNTAYPPAEIVSLVTEDGHVITDTLVHDLGDKDGNIEFLWKADRRDNDQRFCCQYRQKLEDEIYYSGVSDCATVQVYYEIGFKDNYENGITTPFSDNESPLILSATFESHPSISEFSVSWEVNFHSNKSQLNNYSLTPGMSHFNDTKSPELVLNSDNTIRTSLIFENVSRLSDRVEVNLNIRNNDEIISRVYNLKRRIPPVEITFEDSEVAKGVNYSSYEGNYGDKEKLSYLDESTPIVIGVVAAIVVILMVVSLVVYSYKTSKLCFRNKSYQVVIKGQTDKDNQLQENNAPSSTANEV